MHMWFVMPFRALCLAMYVDFVDLALSVFLPLCFVCQSRKLHMLSACMGSVFPGDPTYALKHVNA